MKATKQHRNRFRKNLKQFLTLKESGRLNGSAAAIEEKLEVAADSAGLDFGKEVKAARSEKQEERQNPCCNKSKKNIEKGIKAMKKVIETHEDVDRAMKHPKLGWISFIWGEKGNASKDYAGGYGVSHILAKRDHEGFNDPIFEGQKGKDIALRLPIVIEKGKVSNVYERGRKRDIDFAGYKVILRLDKDGEEKNWVLSGFRMSENRKNPDDAGEFQTLIRHYAPETYLDNQRQMGAGLNHLQDTTNSDKRENQCDCERTNPAIGENCLVTAKAKTNEAKDGIEIRFSADPPEKILDKLNDNGFLYFTPEGKTSFWSASISAQTKKVAETIAGDFDSAVVKLRQKAEGKRQTAEVKGETGHKNINTKDIEQLILDNLLGTKKEQLLHEPELVVNNFFNTNGINEFYSTLPVVKQKKENSSAYKQFVEAKKDVSKKRIINQAKKISPAEKSDPVLIKGNKTTIDFKADGSIEEKGHYALMEVSDLEASHNKDCSQNSKHLISRSQPRDRSKEALCAQPTFIAKNLNPASITQGNLAFVGAPVVMASGHVIQGNGRTIALKIVYDEYKKSAKRYKKYLIENAGAFGFSANQVKEFKQPVLVRVVNVSENRAIKLGNVVDTSQAKMDKIDQAKAYIRNLSDEQLLIIGKLIRESEGETIGAIIDDVGMDIIGQLKELDRTGIVEQNKLTQEGKTFLRSVLVGLVFDAEQAPNVLHHYLNLPHRIKAGLERSFG